MSYANSRWSGFRGYAEVIPSTNYEACVFLQDAILHLMNRTGGPLGDTFEILNGAHEAINECFWEVA
jgi:hypothetical protein